MRILLFESMGDACSYHRIQLPFRYLDLEDGESIHTVMGGGRLTEETFKSVDVVVFNRQPPFDLNTVLAYIKKHNVKLWVDIDDDWELFPEHYLYKSWVEHNTRVRIQTCLKAADIVTATNGKLAEKVKTLNENVVVVPNGLPFGYEQFSPNKIESSFVRFLFAGGASHSRDLGSISKFFDAIAIDREFKKKTKWILAGAPDDHGNPIWKDMVKAMQVVPGFITKPVKPLRSYMEHYNDADVSIAPLEDIAWNSFKSNLKTIEAGCMCIPIVATHMHPYSQDLAVRGVNLCKDTVDWMIKCDHYRRHPSKTIDDGLYLNEYVKRKYDLIKINKIRRQILNSLKS